MTGHDGDDGLPPPQGDEDEDWAPPDPALGGPGQLVVTMAVAVAAALGLLVAAAAVSWVFASR